MLKGEGPKLTQKQIARNRHAGAYLTACDDAMNPILFHAYLLLLHIVSTVYACLPLSWRDTRGASRGKNSFESNR